MIKPILVCRVHLIVSLLTVLSFQAVEFWVGKTQSNSTPNELEALAAGATYSATLSAGESKEYSLNAQAGQNVRLEIAKGDLALRVSACARAGNSCFDFTRRGYGTLILSFTTTVSADYRLQVASLELDDAKRRFELRVAEMAMATSRHRLVDAATRTTAEAEALRERRDLSSQLAAVSKYGEARRQWESAREYGKAAEALCSAGDVYLSLGQYRQALSQYEESLAISKAKGDQLAQLAALNGIGYMNANLGDNDQALQFAQSVLAVVNQVKQTSPAFRRIEAQALNTIGEVHYARRELRESIEVFLRTLLMWQEAEDRSGEALAFLNLGYSYSDLGDLRKGSEYYELSLNLFRTVNDARGVALAQTAQGGVLSILGEPQVALDLHKQATQYFRATGNRRGEAAALNGVAGAYEDLSEDRMALDNYLAALRLYEQIGTRSSVALSKFVVGRAFNQLGERETAEKYFRESIDLSRDVGNKVIEAHALQSLATIYFARGDSGRALLQIESALNLYRLLGNHWSEAYALNDLGHVHASSGNLTLALTSYQQALEFMRAAGDRRGEALTLINLARIERRRKNLTAALPLIEDSISITESLRMRIRNTQLRRSHFTSVHQQYELCIDTLMRLHHQFPERGFARQALVASERSRARSLLDSLLEEKNQPGKVSSHDLVSKELNLLQALDEKAEHQTNLLSRKHTQEEADRLSQEIRSLTVEYQDVRSKLKEENPRHATLTQSGQLRAEDLQNIVNDGETLLLEFALGEERSYLWVVSTDRVESHELPNQSTIDSLARKVYELATVRQSLIEKSAEASAETIREADSEYWRQSAALSSMLLGPVADELGSKRLLIVGDGFLQYIPFDALPDPQKISVEFVPIFLNHEVVSVPSALTLAALRKEKNPPDISGRTIAVLADPVFDKDDPRVQTRQGSLAQASENEAYLSRALRNFGDGDTVERISRLPSTLREAKAIMQVIPQGEGVVTTGFSATKDQIVGAGIKDYRVIHFATHGLLDTEHPELSGIILSLVDEHGTSRNGFLRINDIYNLHLSADLIVLSACRTGLGKTIQGEGVIGLPGAFMYAGAKSVVASLWKVDDEATAELMSHFYTAIFRDGLTPAAALRKAKGEMWKQQRWRAPFYWAAFVFQGQYANEVRVTSGTKLPQLVRIASFLILFVAAAYAVVRMWIKRRLNTATAPGYNSKV